MPRPSNWKSVETSARENGEFCQHEIDDPAIDTDSIKALKERRECRHVDGHGKTPKQAAIAKEAGSISTDPVWMQPNALRDLKIVDLRNIATSLANQMAAVDIEPGDLIDRSIEGMVGNIIRERARLARKMRSSDSVK